MIVTHIVALFHQVHLLKNLLFLLKKKNINNKVFFFHVKNLNKFKNPSPHKFSNRIKKLKDSQILRVNKVNHHPSHHKSSKRIKKCKVNQILRVSKVNHNLSHHKSSKRIRK